MASMNTRLNIKKLDGYIVQKHRGSKQVGFKQLGRGVETGVHGVHYEKRVWLEVELQGAQGDHEAEVFQVSNDDTAVAQRRLEDKQPKEKTNTDCLRSTQQCMKSEAAKHLGVAGIKQQSGLVDETNVTLFAKVKCIFLGYHKSIVGNKLWRLDDVTSKVVLYKNMGFNESVEYKKTFIGSGVGTGSMQVLHGFEFEVEPLGDHTFELACDREQHLACELFRYREDSNEVAFAVVAVEKIYAHKSLTFNNTVACEVISKWNAGLKDDMDARSDVCTAKIWATKGLLDKAKGNVLGMKIVRDQCGYTMRVSQSRFYNGKLIQSLLEGNSILSLEGSLSGDCDVEKNGKWSCIYAVESQEYQMVCMRLDIASADVGILDKFDRGLQTDVQVFVDFDYAIGRSITIMESKCELRLVAGIAIGALVKGGSLSEVPAQVDVVAYRLTLFLGYGDESLPMGFRGCCRLKRWGKDVQGLAISRVIKKGMQSGLSAGIDHGKAGRNLKDIVAYSLAAEADYNFALQRFREVEFPLLAEPSSHKDASVVDIMDLLCLEIPLVDALEMSDLQPDVEQLMLPIHRPKYKVVLGEISLSFSLSVSHSRVEKIRENISAQRSALVDVWVPLVDPLSSKNLMDAADTFDSVPATVVTTTALSTTFTSASFISPITIEDYEIAGMDGQEDARGNV
nr:zinc finger, CCHC-type [Tanacetum cinerariifolium]